MRKRIIAFVLLIAMSVTITACGTTATEKTQSTQTIALTKDNFNDYIIFNISFDDFYVTGDPYVGGYEGFANLNISTALKKDVALENVVINGKVICNGFGWSAKTVDFTLELDNEGKCQYSQQIKTNSGMLKPETPTFFILNELSHAEAFIEISNADFIVKNAVLQVNGTIIQNI